MRESLCECCGCIPAAPAPTTNTFFFPSFLLAMSFVIGSSGGDCSLDAGIGKAAVSRDTSFHKPALRPGSRWYNNELAQSRDDDGHGGGVDAHFCFAARARVMAGGFIQTSSYVRHDFVKTGERALELRVSRAATG